MAQRREKLTGRFADMLSWLYLGTAVVRRYQAEGLRAAGLPVTVIGDADEPGQIFDATQAGRIAVEAILGENGKTN